MHFEDKFSWRINFVIFFFVCDLLGRIYHLIEYKTIKFLYSCWML